MAIETLGEAHSARWKLSVACDGCDIRGERVDLRALLWTRGRAFPIDGLHDRLRCPRCGNRKIQVTWSVPGRYAVEQLDARGEVVEALREGRFDAAVATWERQAQRHRSGRVIMRDGARVVREWPARES